jgi:RND family efflux transporter MFP subunit
MIRQAKKLFFAVLILAMVLALASGALFLVKQRKSEIEELPPPRKPPLAVETARVAADRLALTEQFIGVIRPVRTSELAARATGHLRSVSVDVGDRVEKGRVVATVDDPITEQEANALTARLEGAKKTLAVSKKRFERRKTLIEKGHVAEEGLDEARRQYVRDRAETNRLEHELSAVRSLLSYTRVAAPYDGIISRRLKDAADFVFPGVGILTLEDPDAGYRVLAQIPVTAAERLTPESPVTLAFNDKSLATTLWRIHPAVDAAALAVAEIRTREKPFGLPSGSYVSLSLTFEEAEGLIIPLSCLLELRKSCLVFVIEEKKMTARSVPVTLIAKSGGRAAVKGDIAAGDRLVCGNEALLLTVGDETPVRPVKNQETAAP